ncbi:MAG: hypothetical protein Q7U51_06460, partial [Methanoregula sp.]|nr:hypothetical protein [Methanoregula sp.]
WNMGSRSRSGGEHGEAVRSVRRGRRFKRVTKNSEKIYGGGYTQRGSAPRRVGFPNGNLFCGS